MIIDFDTLAKLAATRKVKAVCAWCARNRIQTFRDTKGRPCTVLSALERALNRGVTDKENEPNYELPPWQNDRPTKKV